MKAFSVIINAIYAIAIVAALLFVVLGFIPEDLSVEPLGLEIGAESEYPATDSKELFEMNFESAVNSYGNTATVYAKTPGNVLTVIGTVDPNDSTTVTTSAIAANSHGLVHTDDTIILKGGDGEILTQEMIMKESNEITIHVYTEISITNNLRYDLLEVNVGVDQISETGTTKYRIVSSEPTSIATGQTASLPVDVEINTLNSALIMMIGESDTFDLNIGFEISAKYLYGLAGAQIYANATFSTGVTNTFDIVVNSNKITVTSTEELELPFEDISAKIGGISIDITNDSSGISIVIDGGTEKIIDVLQDQYDNGDYTIVIDTGDPSNPEIIELTQEEYIQMLDIVRQLMAEALP